MNKLKRFGYWLVVPSGYRFDASDRKRRWGIAMYWVAFAGSMAKTMQIKTLKAQVETMQKTIDLQKETIDNLMDPEIQKHIVKLTEDLLKDQ